MKQIFFWLVPALSAFVLVACGSTGGTVVISRPTQTPQPNLDNLTQQYLSPEKLNQVTPDDVLNEIAYLGMGSPGPCADWNEPFPGKAGDLRDTELLGQVQFFTCGWKTNESLNVSVTYPDGKIAQSKMKADASGSGTVDLQTSFDDLEGLYQIKIASSRAELETNVILRRPVGPRVVDLDGQLQLYNFKPGELIRVFFYVPNDPQARWDFQGWQEFTVGSNGQLRINHPKNDRGSYLVIGAETGEISRGWRIPHISKNPNNLKPTERNFYQCEKISSLPESTDKATLTAASGQNQINLYANPRLSAIVINVLPVNVQVKIYPGVFCSDGQIWRNILVYNTSGAHQGFITEGDLQSFASAKTPPTDLPPNASQAKLCAGVYGGQLQVGEVAKIVVFQVSVRRAPGGPDYGQLINVLAKDQKVTIIQAPVCVNGMYFVKIQSKLLSETGWVAEGDQDGYYLVPIQ